jgi:hypothetical protein
MILFLVVTVPCAAFLYFRLFYRRFISSDELRRAVLSGLTAHLVLLIPIFLMHGNYPLHYTYRSLFFAEWVEEFLLFLILGSATAVLLRRRLFRLPTEEGQWAESTAFWTGFLFVSGIYHGFLQFPAYDAYRVFLYPLLLLVLLYLSSLVTHFILTRDRLWVKILMGILGIISSLLISLVPFLLRIHYTAHAYTVFGLALLILAMLVYLVETKRLPL